MGNHPFTPNSKLPKEVKSIFQENAHEKVGNTKKDHAMENLGGLLSYMNLERDRGGDWDAQQGVNANVFWALYNLHKEIKNSRKEILIHRIEALRIKIEEINGEIAKAEKSSRGQVIHSAAKTVVNHIKGLAETMIGFATENPVLTALGCASLGLTTTEDVEDLVEKLTAKGEFESETNRLKKELLKLENDMANNKDKLRKTKDSDGN